MPKQFPSRSKGVPARKRFAKPKLSSGQARQELEEKLLEQISYGAGLCAQLEEHLAGRATPELQTLIKLYRVMILRLSIEANAAPELLPLASDLIKPVLDWARLEEKRKEREFAEQKYRDQVAAQKSAAHKVAKESSGKNALKPETLQKIERELRLF